MTSGSFHRQLDLPADPLRPGFVLPEDSDINHYLVLPAAEVLTPTILHRFQQLGLRPGTAALFLKTPGSMGVIHTDVALRGSRWRRNVAAINWNLSGAESLMRWYEVDAPGTVPDRVPPPDAGPWHRALNGIHFGFFGSRTRRNLPRSRVRILEEAAIGSATLVRTNLPHAVENTDRSRGRWALSVRFDPDFTNWQAAVTALRPLMIRRRPGSPTAGGG